MIEIILTSSVLILLMVILRRVLRGKIHPCVQYALWLLVAIRLLIPGTLFEAPVSMMGAVQASLYETLPGNLPEPVPNQPAVPPEAYPGGDIVVDYQTAAPAITQRVIRWPDIIWKTGIAVTGGALVVSNLVFSLRLRRNRKRLALPDTPWSGDLPVYESDGLPSPCLFGLFRPAIYLNEAAMETEHPEHILAHEYAHYRHGDHVWAILRSVCLAVHWYNPLVWWAAALSRRDCELACDASALRRLGEDARIDYGQTLLGMVSRSRTPAAFLHTATTMTAGKRAMKERISLIVKEPRMRKLTLALVALLAVLLAACSFGRAAEPQEIPVAVSVGQSASSNLNDYSLITDPDEVARLWEIYQNFEYDGPYDPTGMGGWPVSVSFRFGDEPDDGRDVFFILSQHGIFTSDGENLRLKNIDEVYEEFLRASTSNPIHPDAAAYDPLADNARSIVEQAQQGADVSEWLPLMNYMDWGVLRQAAVEDGMDDGDGSGAAVEIIGAITAYVEETGASMTAAEYLYILSATEGLDGAVTEGYSYLVYRMHTVNPSQFAYVVLEMLPEAQQNEVLDFFRYEWAFYHEPYTDDVPSREAAITQLESDLSVGVSASPSEMTLRSAGSTFQFQIINAFGTYALTYTSSDPGVASVDVNGVVTAVGPGEAVITMAYEGAGGPLEFTCQVKCDWEVAVPEPASEPSSEPSGELTDEWQREFAGFVFGIPAMPDQEEFTYDGTVENGLETAVLSALNDYYSSYVAQNGSSEYNDRFDRIILESDIPEYTEYRERVTVAYQVQCLRDREHEGKSYTLAPQTGEHLSTTFTTSTRLGGWLGYGPPIPYSASYICTLTSGSAAGEENWNLEYIRQDIQSRTAPLMQADRDLSQWSITSVSFADGSGVLPEEIVSGTTVEVRYNVNISYNGAGGYITTIGPLSVTYTFSE